MTSTYYHITTYQLLVQARPFARALQFTNSHECDYDLQHLLGIVRREASFVHASSAERLDHRTVGGVIKVRRVPLVVAREQHVAPACVPGVVKRTIDHVELLEHLAALRGHFARLALVHSDPSALLFGILLQEPRRHELVTEGEGHPHPKDGETRKVRKSKW